MEPPIMTGKHHGSIATLEELLSRPLQWAICLLHTNELPLRHVFKHLDGVSASPDSFSGPIGKELNGLVSDWKVVNFRPLSSNEFPYLPQEVIQITHTRFAVLSFQEKLKMIWLSFK